MNNYIDTNAIASIITPEEVAAFLSRPKCEFSSVFGDIHNLMPVLKRVVPKKVPSTKQQLQSVDLVVNNGSLDIYVTNGDQVLRMSVPVEEGHGRCSIPFFDFAKIVSKCPTSFRKDLLALSLGEENTEIMVKHGAFTLNHAQPHEKQTDEGDCEFNFDYHKLQRLLDKVIPCVSTDESRYYLGGVLFQRGDGELTLHATDGHRLACLKTQADGEHEQCLVPLSILLRVQDCIGKYKPGKGKSYDIGFKVSDRRVTFAAKEWAVSETTIDGNFPDVHQVIPRHHNIKGEFDRVEWLENMQAAGVASPDGTGGVRLFMNGHTNKLEISSKTTGGASFSSQVATEFTNEQGEPCPNGMEIGINSSYVLDAIEKMEGERVLVTGTNHLAPITLATVPLEGEDSDIEELYVVMPMRL